MNTHTPEPWEINGSLIVKDCYSGVICDTDVSINFQPKRYIEHAESRANRERIVSCVNACAGIKDPSVVPELLEALKSVLQTVHTDVEWPDVYRKARILITKAST